MKIRVPEYYKDFACIGGTCIDTCCAGWEVDVDKKSSAYYKSVEGAFGDRLRSMLVDYPIEDRFILQEHGRCPFLNDRNLCDIYSELGEDKLCETCTNFPRHITEFGNTREIGISLSCPVAVELIMKRREPITFKLSENSEPVSGYNNIDASLYFKLCQARDIAYSICQNRSLPVKHRTVLLLDFSHAIQKRIRNRKIDRVLDNYKDINYCNKRIERLEKKYGNYKKHRKLSPAGLRCMIIWNILSLNGHKYFQMPSLLYQRECLNVKKIPILSMNGNTSMSICLSIISTDIFESCVR